MTHTVMKVLAAGVLSALMVGCGGDSAERDNRGPQGLDGVERLIDRVPDSGDFVAPEDDTTPVLAGSFSYSTYCGEGPAHLALFDPSVFGLGVELPMGEEGQPVVLVREHEPVARIGIGAVVREGVTGSGFEQLRVTLNAHNTAPNELNRISSDPSVAITDAGLADFESWVTLAASAELRTIKDEQGPPEPAHPLWQSPGNHSFSTTWMTHDVVTPLPDPAMVMDANDEILYLEEGGAVDEDDPALTRSSCDADEGRVLDYNRPLFRDQQLLVQTPARRAVARSLVALNDARTTHHERASEVYEGWNDPDTPREDFGGEDCGATRDACLEQGLAEALQDYADTLFVELGDVWADFYIEADEPVDPTLRTVLPQLARAWLISDLADQVFYYVTSWTPREDGVYRDAVHNLAWHYHAMIEDFRTVEDDQ